MPQVSYYDERLFYTYPLAQHGLRLSRITRNISLADPGLFTVALGSDESDVELEGLPTSY